MTLANEIATKSSNDSECCRCVRCGRRVSASSGARRGFDDEESGRNDWTDFLTCSSAGSRTMLGERPNAKMILL